MGCRLVVKATDFDSVIAGSNPAIPAIFFLAYDSLAQLAEHLTFNQGVRSSNLRWVTKNSASDENFRSGVTFCLFYAQFTHNHYFCNFDIQAAGKDMITQIR